MEFAEVSSIRRIGNSRRWSDVVIHNDVAYWAEVAEKPDSDVRCQISQVLRQIDTTLAEIGSDRTRVIQVMIHLANLADVTILNEVWDGWVSPGHAPIRACVQSGLAQGYFVEMLITAATP